MKRCITAGLCKINVNRLVLDGYYAHFRSESSRKLPHTTLIEEGIECVIKQTKEWMDICGSSGKVP